MCCGDFGNLELIAMLLKFLLVEVEDSIYCGFCLNILLSFGFGLTRWYTVSLEWDPTTASLETFSIALFFSHLALR